LPRVDAEMKRLLIFVEKADDKFRLYNLLTAAEDEASVLRTRLSSNAKEFVPAAARTCAPLPPPPFVRSPPPHMVLFPPPTPPPHVLTALLPNIAHSSPDNGGQRALRRAPHQGHSQALSNHVHGGSSDIDPRLLFLDETRGICGACLAAGRPPEVYSSHCYRAPLTKKVICPHFKEDNLLA